MFGKHFFENQKFNYFSTIFSIFSLSDPFGRVEAQETFLAEPFSSSKASFYNTMDEFVLVVLEEGDFENREISVAKIFWPSWSLWFEKRSDLN